jgi:hypothetical protein
MTHFRHQTMGYWRASRAASAAPEQALMLACEFSVFRCGLPVFGLHLSPSGASEAARLAEARATSASRNIQQGYRQLLFGKRKRWSVDIIQCEREIAALVDHGLR